MAGCWHCFDLDCCLHGVISSKSTKNVQTVHDISSKDASQGRFQELADNYVCV